MASEWDPATAIRRDRDSDHLRDPVIDVDPGSGSIYVYTGGKKVPDAFVEGFAKVVIGVRGGEVVEVEVLLDPDTLEKLRKAIGQTDSR